MGIQGRRAAKMLPQELLGCTLFNPTDTEHCLLHQFMALKKEHMEFFLS